jgi:multiple antibiotic resistance protein
LKRAIHRCHPKAAQSNYEPPGYPINLIAVAPFGVTLTVLIALIVYLSYLAAPWLAKRLGRTGMHIAYRISVLILASLGVQFIVLGVAELLQPLLK